LKGRRRRKASDKREGGAKIDLQNVLSEKGTKRLHKNESKCRRNAKGGSGKNTRSRTEQNRIWRGKGRERQIVSNPGGEREKGVHLA